VRSFGGDSFQRAQVRDDVGQFLARETISIRRHLRSPDEAMLAQFGFLKAPQLLLFVKHQNLKGVEIQQPAGHNGTVPRDDAIETILGKNFGVGIEERRYQLCGGAERPDVSEVWTEARTLALNSVARQARAFTGNEAGPGGCVAAGTIL
jgi:hypothetical protein